MYLVAKGVILVQWLERSFGKDRHITQPSCYSYVRIKSKLMKRVITYNHLYRRDGAIRDGRQQGIRGRDTGLEHCTAG